MFQRTLPAVCFLTVAVALQPTTALAATSVPGFPRKLGGPIDSAVVVADLMGTSEQVIIVGTGKTVQAFTVDGKSPKGFPFALEPNDALAGAPAAADQNGDRRAELAFTTKAGRVYLWSNGALVPGFPVTLEGGCLAGPSFADLDGDGHLELLQGDRQGKLHAFHKGAEELKGYPVSLNKPLTSSVSVGKFRTEVVVAVGAEDGTVFVLSAAGKALPGFPLVTHAAVTGAPAFGDIDDDARADLVVASKDFKVYAVDEAGAPVHGFPFATGLGCYGGPSLADLDDDGVLDVVVSSSDGSLYALDGNGKLLPGFPVLLGPTALGTAAVGDLDRDGRLDLLATSTDGKLHALSAKGKPLQGYPVKVAEMISAAPFLVSLRKEAELVALVGAPDGTLAAYRFDVKSGAAPMVAWSSAGRDAARGGWYFPNPPRFKDLVVQPESARIDDVLKAEWHYSSVDGAVEPPVTLTWFKEGKGLKELEGKRELPTRTAKKGERWRFELKVGSRIVKSGERLIADTPPTAPVVKLVPAAPTREAPLKVEITTPSTDPDGNPVSYRVSWLKNGLPAGGTTQVIGEADLKKADRWTVLVRGFDGVLESELASAHTVVGNAAPSAAQVSLAPASARRGEPLAVTVTKPAPDLDQDALQYRYRWKVNGEARNHPLGLATLPPELLRKGDKIEVSVTAFDGEAEGPAVSAAAQLVNTPPVAPKIVLLPEAPRAGQALRAVVVGAAVDADGDAVRYRAAWTRDGKAWGTDALEVPAAEVKKGARWAVSVVPNDGAVDGPAATAEKTIQDTPPTAPVLALRPERPMAGAPITLVVVKPSEDVDGDALKSTHVWTRSGKAVSGAADRMVLAPGEFQKHEKVRVAVTPSDGTLAGEVGEVEVTVANAPPGAPAVALEPKEPTVLSPLKAVVTKAAPDADGDALRYRYTWLKDGVAQTFPEEQAEVPASALRKGERWTVRVRAHDGEELGPPASATAQVANAAPKVPGLALSPRAPKRGEGLRAVLTEATDPDGDALFYRLAWKRDGKPVLTADALGVSGDDRDAPKKGELWSVDVIATDALASSPAAHAEVKIANTAPRAPAVSLCQGPAVAGAPLELTVVEPSTDVDSDPVSYEYAWTVNGKPQPAWDGKRALGAGETRKHDRLRVTVTPTDGTDRGLAGAAECEVEDTAPTAPKVALEPASPSAETGVVVKVLERGTDADGDAVSYRYAWKKNGLPFAVGGDGTTVKPLALRRGDLIEVAVTSFDGEREGGRAVAAGQAVNSLPPSPKVSLTPAQPVAGESLRCNAEAPKTDADGEPLRLHYGWFAGGKSAAIAVDQPVLPSGVVAKGETWRCEAWTDDGVVHSPPSGAEVAVKNSAPLAPRVAVEPERPGTADDLICRLSAVGSDADGDALRYEYRWTRDGKAVAAGSDPSRVPAEQTRKGEKWRCAVTASDGTVESPVATAEVKIANSAPAGTAVRVTPAQPGPGEALSCEILGSASDPDGDAVSYRLTWLKDGVAQSFSFASAQVPGRLVKSSDLWSCRAQATDGELESAASDSETVVVRESGSKVLVGTK